LQSKQGAKMTPCDTDYFLLRFISFPIFFEALGEDFFEEELLVFFFGEK